MSFETPDDQHQNPMEILKFEADAVNLLGRSGGETDLSGDAQRISYQEVEAVREALTAEIAPYVRDVDLPPLFEGDEPFTVQKAVLPEELSSAIRRRMVEGVGGIADGSMSGRELSKFNVAARFFVSGWDQDGKRISIQGDSLFGPTTEAADGLSFTVAMLEGNVVPNDLGYRFDEHVSLPRKCEIAREELERVGQIIEPEEPGDIGEPVFGDAATTARLVNDIVDRAELHHPTFMGKIIGEPFPRIEEPR